MRNIALGVISLLLLVSYAQAAEKEAPETFFAADEMESDEKLGTVTAKGNVKVERENLTLFADKVVYNQKEDIITAAGNVVVLEQDGSVAFSDYIELTEKMSVGESENIKIIMRDKTRISARTASKQANDDKIMQGVTYTPCDVCQNKSPLWKLRADEVTHDAANKDMYYKNAVLEIKDVPVLWLPYMTHPDPTVKRRSGLLPPSFGSTNYLGTYIQPKYFWDVSDNTNFIFKPTVSTDENVILGGQYQTYLPRGEMDLDGSFLPSKNGDNRGNLIAKTRYELNDFWLFKTNINYASDPYYLKDMLMPQRDDSWLTSEVAFEGFDNRNYASISGYYYTILSNNLNNFTKPVVAPLFEYENYGPVQKYGSYNKNTFSLASVYYEGEQQSQRFSMINAWELPYISPIGERYKLSASVKSDAFYVNDYAFAPNETFDGDVYRVFPQLGMEWRLPFAKETDTGRQILEPVLVGVVAPNGGNEENKIPNNDSYEALLNDTNVLSLDRYAGYDRNDTGSRLSYGLNWSYYGERLGHSSVFLAQSYYFNKNSDFNIRDKDGHFSDYVGRAYVEPNDKFSLDYRFRLDKDNMDILYSELGSAFGQDIFKFYVSYIYLTKNNNVNAIDQRERNELYTSLSLKLLKDWSLTIYNRQDLTKFNSASLERGLQVIYEDECLKFLVYFEKTDSSDPRDEDSGLDIGATFYLKTLGGTEPR